MEKIASKSRIDKESFQNLIIPGGNEIIKRQIASEIGKSISEKLDITRVDRIDKPYFEYSTEFYLSQAEEIKCILEHLRRIYSLTDNYFIHENIRKIQKIITK